MEFNFYEPKDEVPKPDAEVQNLIDSAFPKTLRKIIEKKLQNKLEIKSVESKTDTTIELTPKNYLGKGISGLVMSGTSEEFGLAAYKLFTTSESSDSTTTEDEFNTDGNFGNSGRGDGVFADFIYRPS